MRSSNKTKGIALISALGFLVVTGIMVAIALSLSASERRDSANDLRTLQAQYAAEAGVERAVYEAYFAPLEDEESEPMNLSEFRDRLDELGFAIPEEESVSEVREFAADLDDSSYSVKVRRRDEDEASVLEVLSAGELGDEGQLSERFIAENLVFAPALEPGFGVLSENTGCLLCHSTVSSLAAAYDDDGNLNLPLQNDLVADELRVRVGALNGFHSERPAEVDSRVTGSVYVRGGTNLAGELQGVPFQEIGDEASDFLSDEAFTNFAALERVDCSGSCEEKYAAWYDDYPLAGAPDGDLPLNVPLAVEDTDEDGKVDMDEWRNAIAAEESAGRIKGGQKSLRANDENFQVDAGAPFLDKGGAVLSSSQSARGIGGHLTLTGSAANPLLLDGTVYVSGDVVISGYVSGNGKLVAQGNVYIDGDLRYACDADSQDFELQASLTCNYAEPQALPRFALAALGNIVIGPYQARQLSEDSGASAEVLSKRFSCANADACTDSDIDAFYRDYHDPGSRALTVEQGIYSPSSETSAEDYTLSAALAQLALHNQTAFEGTSTRFYKLRDDTPIYRCERSSVTDSYCKSYNDPRLIEIDEATLAPEASVLSLGPSGDWLAAGSSSPTDLASETILRERWIQTVETGSREPGALQIDGALQAGGALVGFLPTGSNTQGELLLQGSLLAADTALLATQGATLLYDPRLESVLNMRGEQPLVLERRGYRLLSSTQKDDW